MSPKTLANWEFRARQGEALVKRESVKPVTELEAEMGEDTRNHRRLNDGGDDL